MLLDVSDKERGRDDDNEVGEHVGLQRAERAQRGLVHRQRLGGQERRKHGKHAAHVEREHCETRATAGGREEEGRKGES